MREYALTMAVGDVVNHLANSPAALTIGSRQLRVTQACNCAAKIRGQRLDLGDRGRALRGRGGGALEFTDGKAE